MILVLKYCMPIFDPLESLCTLSYRIFYLCSSLAQVSFRDNRDGGGKDLEILRYMKEHCNSIF